MIQFNFKSLLFPYILELYWIKQLSSELAYYSFAGFNNVHVDIHIVSIVQPSDNFAQDVSIKRAVWLDWEPPIHKLDPGKNGEQLKNNCYIDLRANARIPKLLCFTTLP